MNIQKLDLSKGIVTAKVPNTDKLEPVPVTYLTPGTQATQTMAITPAPLQSQSISASNHTMLYLGIGGGVVILLLLIIIIITMIKKR